MEKILPVIAEIDKELAKILKLKANMAERIQNLAEILQERRISRAMEARPEAVKGEEEPRIRPPKKPKRAKKEDTSIPLDRFIR